jgi:uncharacterized membrane protein
MNKSFLIRLSFFLLVLLWCSGILINYFNTESGSTILFSYLLNFLYGNLCHQEAEKIISINGFQLLLCARCSGIYFGALLISLLLLFTGKIKPRFYLLISASSFLLIDILVNNFLFNSYNKLTAALTGLFFGLVSTVFILDKLEDYFGIQK